MREARIQTACTVAKQFIKDADNLLQSPNKDYEIVGSKLSGMLRRTSMNLTRILAEMRKP
jgi:hypothetical protein